MTAIIDYGVGNLFSLICSFRKLGEEAIVTNDPAVLEKADRILLPGVGAFRDAADKLEKSGLVPILRREIDRGKPVLGICLGMQLLFDKSYEYGECKGLSLVSGEIQPLSGQVGNRKVPHMGWNALTFIGEKHPLFRYVEEGACVYFVHSFHAVNCRKNLIATTEYGIPVTAAVADKNVMGCQFHPEKSGDVGLNVLRAFCEMNGGSVC